MIYLALLKRFWPILAGALLLVIVWRWHSNAVKDAYQEGVKVTEDAQAEVIARVRLENEKREQAMALVNVKLETQLEDKTRETNQLTADLAATAATSKLCLRDLVRSRATAENPGPATGGNGTAGDSRPAETLGEAVNTIVAECQRSTDKLITLQSYVRELKANGF